MLTTLALALTQVSGPQAPALHPETAEFVLAVPDLQGALAAYGETALARTMKDADLQAVLGEVMGSGPVDPVELLVQQLRGMEGELPPVLDMHRGVRSMSVSVDTESIAGLLAMMGAGMDTGAPSIEARWVFDFEDEASREAWVGTVTEYLGASAFSGDSVSSGSLTLENGGGFGSTALAVSTLGGAVEDPSEGSGSAMVIVDGGTRALVLFNIADVEAEAKRVAGAGEGAFSAQLSDGRQKLGAGEGAPMMELYMSPYFGAEAVKAGMENGPGAAELLVAGPVLSMLELMMGAPISGLIRGGHWDVRIKPDGRFVTRGWSPGASPLPILDMVGGEAMDAASLDLAHPDALVTSVASFDPGRLMDTFVGFDGDAEAAEEAVESAMGQMEEAYGFRVDRDLIAPLGGSASYSLPKLRSLLAAPNLMAAARLDDRETFLKGMDGLLAMLNDSGGAMGQRTDYRGAAIYTWTLGDPGGGGMQPGGMGSFMPDLTTFVRPTVTVMDDRVLLSTLPTHAKREVRRVAKLLKAGEEAALHEGFAQLEVAEGASMVTFADWPMFFGNLYTQLRALAPMLGGLAGGGQDLPLPFKLDSLPDMELLTRHFRPSTRYSVVSGGGRLDVTESSIGPEVGVLSVLSLGVSPFLMRSTVPSYEEDEWIESELMVAPAGAPASEQSELAVATEASMMSISVAVKMYQLDHGGSPPADLAELQKAEGGKPAYLLELARDGWGREFKYSVDGDTYKLWSMGANGIDESGQGDDLLVR